MMQKKFLLLVVALFGVFTVLLFARPVNKDPVESRYIQKAEEELVDQNYKVEREQEAKWLLKNKANQPEGFAYLGKAQGYADKIIILVITDLKRQIQDISVIKHTETPSYFQRLVDNRFFDQFIGKDPANIGEQDDIDNVSGATITCEAILHAIENAYRRGEGNSD